jgi:hypothetical protein
MHRSSRVLGSLALFALLAAVPAASRIAEPAPPVPGHSAPAQQHPLQSDCSERVGPFVTQDTAWARLHEAESQGYGVSGVFPCYDGDTRGYCFNVFYPC